MTSFSAKVSTDSTAPTPAFRAGDWVASRNERQPMLAQVKKVYSYDGEWLLDLVIYARNGTKIGRDSPACGGPRGFEPACDATRWGRIEAPDWAYLSETRYEWADRLRWLDSAQKND